MNRGDFTTVMILFLVGCMLIFRLTTKPESNITPMDVYQGKTTLEYKIVDGNVIDSVVV